MAVAGAVAHALPVGVEIVDAHVHLGRDADGHLLTADELLRDMRSWGVARSVCFAPNDPGAGGQFRSANQAVADAARSHPERIVAFCRLDPLHDGWEEELRRAVGDGARGLKLHPVAQRFRPESPECARVVAAATEAGLPVLLHAGFGARPLAEPIGALAEGVPEARFILAHGGRGDAQALAARFGDDPRVLFDTSLATLPDLVELPPARLAFGTDRPYGDHASGLHLVSLAARAAGWSEEELRGVLAGNLTRWLDA